jgi:hypothetical protein
MSGVVAIVTPTPARPCCRAISERIQAHSLIRVSSSAGISTVQYCIGVGLRIVVSAAEKEECQRGSSNGSAGNRYVTIQCAAASRSGMRQIDYEISVEI